jgi:hypothetical protein
VREGKEKPSKQFLTIRRITWAITGVLWFLWIGYEDRGVTAILIMSAVITFPVGLEFYRRRGKGDALGQAAWIIRGLSIGAMSGALVGPVALLLASLKTSLHQHEVADFGTDELILLVNRIPVWALAGVLFGTAGAMLGWESRKSRNSET